MTARFTSGDGSAKVRSTSEGGNGLDVTPDWKPEFSGGIGRKKPASARRSGAAGWERLRAAKLGPCRVCRPRRTFSEQLHHLVPRSQGGADVEDNLVPLCRKCHDAVTRRDRAACQQLHYGLSAAEREYALGVLGPDRFHSYYPGGLGDE